MLIVPSSFVIVPFIRICVFHRVPSAIGVGGYIWVFVGEWVDGEPEREWRGIEPCSEVIIPAFFISFFSGEFVPLIVAGNGLISHQFSIRRVVYVLHRNTTKIGNPMRRAKVVTMVVEYLLLCPIILRMSGNRVKQDIFLREQVQCC